MSRAGRIAARGAILALALVLAAKVTLDGLATRFETRDPLLAAEFAPDNAEIAVAAAAKRAGANSGTRDPRVRRLVSSALARGVAEPPAIEFRALEAGADGDIRREAALFRLSDAISRRSLPTRLWLIQDAVQRGDVAGALGNFDIALRTSTDAPATLFPILAYATADPTLSVPLARLFDRPSDWRALFFHFAIDADAAPGLARVVPLMRDSAWIKRNGIDDSLIGRLVADGDFAAARRIYRLYHHDRRPGALIRDGDFADAGAVFPFGWQFVQKGEIGAERSLIGGRPMLAFQALSGGDGVVASQLLMLPPGRYRLSIRTGATSTDADAPPYWTITCADGRGQQIALLDMSVVKDGIVSASFAVPDVCAAQWLAMALRGSDNPGGQAGAVAAVAVASAAP
ncbi:MAG TPA: hypothetical protein VFT56_16740 [Sphingomonas sp.]|nr:hypothetical protein [Sphingomonas sp.]